MTPFRIHTGLVAPMDRENVDTDAIIPKQVLKSIKRSGFGPKPVRLMDFRNCFGMIASVSTFSRSIGATRPL